MTTAASGSAKEGELRQRAAKSNDTKETPKTTSTRTLDTTPSSISPTDILRFITGILLASTIASYLVTSGETYLWGLENPAKRPWWTSPAALRRHFSVPLELTNDQLAAYDGSDSGSPIYLALNRTIYDVSSSPHVYGPGGPYSQLAAKDASRSYVTTCFDPVEDLVPYLGGLDELYVPLWLSKKPAKEEIDGMAPSDIFNGMGASDLMDKLKAKIGRKNLKILQDEAYEKAHEMVRDKISNWETMFAKKNYPIVGRVVGVDEEDPMKWRHLGFCEEAKKLRPPMTESIARAMELAGKDPNKMNLKNMFPGGKKAEGAEKPKKKKKSSKKKKKKAGAEGSGKDSTDHGYMGNTDHASNDKANVRIEDMLAGGKFHAGKKGAQADKVEEMFKSGPMGGNAAKAKEGVEALQEDGAEMKVPDAVPEAIQEDAAEKAGL